MDDPLRRSAEEFVANAIGDSGILGHYIVIAETLNEHGMALQFATSDNLPPWIATGMLNSISGMIDAATMGQPEFFDDDDDEEG